MEEREILRIAADRVKCNGDHPTSQFWGKALQIHTLGVRGEAALADYYHFSYDKIQAKPGGDGGADFVVHFNGVPMRFDVKTRDLDRDQRRIDLLVPAHKFEVSRSDAIFVLAHCWKQVTRVVAWEYPEKVRSWPIQNLKVPTHKLAVPTHVCPLMSLRPMKQLDRLIFKCDEFKERA